MTVIGHFVPDTDGYVGSIRTLTLHAKIRLVAIDNKANEDGPDFRSRETTSAPSSMIRVSRNLSAAPCSRTMAS
jgi:uncharacterized protein (DUF736 family)